MLNERPSLFDFTFDELQVAMAQAGHSKFIAVQIFDWVYRKFDFNPENWTNVSKKTREYISSTYNLDVPQIVWNGLSSDGTRKFLVKMADQQTVESVAIPAKTRLTLCISSQVGCAIGCTFCHTGTQGLKRHLKTGEITGQFMAVSRWLMDNASPYVPLTNIVYMGQGEPLHNYENVRKATINFMEAKGMNLGQRRITLSTSGMVPQIEKLADFPPVNIAISLHAVTNEVRTKLMPINKVYDLERLFQAIRTIPLKAYRRITYEYLLIDGLNNGPEDIEGLCNLLTQKESKINLIPFNEYPGSNFKRPSRDNVIWFRDEMERRGYCCTIRTTKGGDILAACGQLKSSYEKLNLWNKPVSEEIQSSL